MDELSVEDKGISISSLLGFLSWDSLMVPCLLGGKAVGSKKSKCLPVYLVHVTN